MILLKMGFAAQLRRRPDMELTGGAIQAVQSCAAGLIGVSWPASGLCRAAQDCVDGCVSINKLSKDQYTQRQP